jgi:hypothetical protein
MKLITISILLAFGVSAPALAQQTANPPAKTVATQEAAPSVDDTLIGEITSTEEQIAMLRRCAGPPPRPIASAAPKETPASEPAVLADAGSHSPAR